MKKKIITIMFLFSVLGIFIYIFLTSGSQIITEWKIKFRLQLLDKVASTFSPSMYYAFEGDEQDGADWLEEQAKYILPISEYASAKESIHSQIEDDYTHQMILQLQAEDEEKISQDLLELEDTQETSAASVASLSIDKLRDNNYLLSKFYTVDSTTTVKNGQLDVDKFLSKDMHIDTKGSGPKVLIFHTHSQEAFVDSVAGDSETSIVGIGKYLAQQLNQKGIETMHHDGVYDLIDGKLDRSKAYELSEYGVREILNQNASIEVVIDLHRDGVKENQHLVTNINGKPTAKIMFFNGLSRTKTNGDIDYLPNPYIQDNLAFSFQMQLASETLYPGLARRIYLKGYRYSLHMMPKSLLIEAGAQTNTVQEMKNAMDLLANILADVLL